MGRIESADVTRYAIGQWAHRHPDPVLSTMPVTGAAAEDLVRAILAAPEGSGPNSPDDCMPHVMYGNEVAVLTVRGTQRSQEVFVRYSGCDGHGFDDDDTHRRLTADSMRLLFPGPHQPQMLHRAVAELLWPDVTRPSGGRRGRRHPC